MASEGFRRSGAGPSASGASPSHGRNDSRSTLALRSSTENGFNATNQAIQYNAFNERLDGPAARRRAELEDEMKQSRVTAEEKKARKLVEKAEKKAQKQARKQAKKDEKIRKKAEKDGTTLAEAEKPEGNAPEYAPESDVVDEFENPPASPASLV